MVILEFFNHDPQFDIKFWNLASNFETQKSIGDNCDYMCRYLYTWSVYPKDINKIEGHFWYQKQTFRAKKRKVT